MRRIAHSILHNTITAPALSQKVLVEDFRHLTLLLLLISATATIKVKLSDADDVNFANPSTVSNPWYYADLKGLGDGGITVTGATGVTSTAASSQKAYAINVDNARWMAVDVEALSAGSVSALLGLAIND